jgi:hypothetical protein
MNSSLKRKLGYDTFDTQVVLEQDTMSSQFDNLVRKYLMREDRKDVLINFSECEEGTKLISETNDLITNELVVLRKTELSIRDFSLQTEKLAYTSNRVCPANYLDIQLALGKYNKSVCYYVVYSEADKKFRDIVAVFRDEKSIHYYNSLLV